jgi:putative intracellular protease/amidase
MKIPRPVLIAAVPIAALCVLALALPALLTAAGLNHPYTGPRYQAAGKRALIITTSHDTLGESGKKTGVYASELTVPYYTFLDGGMTVDVASILGGAIPIEPVSLRWPLLSPEDRRYLADPGLRKRVGGSLAIADLDFTTYDVIFLAGGWGAAYDLGYSALLGQKLSQAWAAKSVLGSVCHGALGFLLAKGEGGLPLVKGRRMTAVTDKQVRELRITITPQHPERELRAAGALYESSSAFLDIFASHVVADGRLVTGQNQNDGAETAQLLMKLVVAREGN